MGRPNEKGINNQRVHKCILAKGDIAKYTQGVMKILWVHMYFLCSSFSLAIKRCPHVLTMKLYIFLIVNPEYLTCCAGRHLVYIEILV